MKRKFTALLAAFALAATTLAPSVADARDRRGGHDGYRGGHHYYDGGRNYRRHRGNDGDAAVAGVVGLVLGLALGAAASSPPRQQYGGCYDNYRRCAAPPPPPCGNCYNQGYYDQGYSEPYYDDRRSAYEQDYGQGPPQGSYDPYYDDQQRSGCTRRERQWDRYAQRYVTVDVPC